MISELKKNISCEFLENKEDIYPYAYDTSVALNGVSLPYCVALPETIEDVQKIVKFAIKNNMVIIPRGAGTCHSAGCRVSNDKRKAIIIHFSKMNNIIEIDEKNLTAKVQPNVVLGDLQREIDKFNLFFPPDPSNLEVSTIGGAIALSSSGPRTFKYGQIKNYVLNLKIVNGEGEIVELAKDLRKNVTGFNLCDIFIGTEGTCGIVVEATLKLIPKPAKTKLILAYFKSIEEAGVCVTKILTSNVQPSTLDILDDKTLITIEKFNPTGLYTRYEAALLIELDGENESIQAESKKLQAVLESANAEKIVNTDDEATNENIWRARRSSFACCAKLAPNVVTEDIVVSTSKIPEMIKFIRALSQKYGIMACIMGHAGDGNIHPNFALDLENITQLTNFKKLKDELFKGALKMGGTLSGEHGIGMEKRKYLQDAINPKAHSYMLQIKQIFDPHNIFNPDKAI
ncbi:FAD-binding protein [bacterium]|nr:FAD-binding protein [bacterium]